MFSANEIIDFAIRIEQNGEDLCRKAARKMIDPALASLLQWMADQEAQHVRWLHDQRTKFGIVKSATELEQLGKALLSDVLGDQSFSLQDADFSGMHHVKELLVLLIEFEKDTVLFYEMLQAAAGDEQTDGLLDKIIAEEKQHILKIRDYFLKQFGRMQ